MQKYNKNQQRNKSYSHKKKFKKKAPRGGTQGRYVVLRDGEHVESLMKRFKRVVESSGVMRELKRREYYMSPSEKRRDKKAKALKRLRKRMRASQRYNG